MVTQFPCLFIVGCPRSGTTSIQRMLVNHPNLAVANDTYFIPRVVERFKLDRDLRLTKEIVDFVGIIIAHDDLVLVMKIFYSQPSYAKLILNLLVIYQTLAEQHKKRHLVKKHLITFIASRFYINFFQMLSLFNLLGMEHLQIYGSVRAKRRTGSSAVVTD